MTMRTIHYYFWIISHCWWLSSSIFRPNL